MSLYNITVTGDEGREEDIVNALIDNGFWDPEVLEESED